MKSGKTCSPSRRKPRESLFIRTETNLKDSKTLWLTTVADSDSQITGGGGKEGTEGVSKNIYKRGGAALPGPSSGSATEIDLLGLYLLFSKCGPHDIFMGIYPFLYL